MGIRLEAINLIVPIRNIERSRYPGGFAGLRERYGRIPDSRFWHDEHLFRDGASSSGDVWTMISFWEDQGLSPTISRDGVLMWHDLCVVDVDGGGLTLPCPWLRVSDDLTVAFLEEAHSG